MLQPFMSEIITTVWGAAPGCQSECVCSPPQSHVRFPGNADCLLKAIHLVQLMYQPSVDEGYAFEDDLSGLKVLQQVFHNVAGLRAVINMKRPRCGKHVRISHRGQRIRASMRSKP